MAKAEFSFGIFTNLSSEHLDTHKTMEEYYKVKASFIEGCERKILNGDDEYSKRLKQSEREIIGWENRVKSLEHKLRDARNEINSYKIKFNEVAVTKEEIKAEIIEEVKKALILTFQNHKGALSKKSACEIIDAYSCNKCARYDGDDETGGAE